VCSQEKSSVHTPCIRSGQHADVPAVAALETAVFSDAWSREDIASHTEASHLVFLVATLGEQVVGYLLGSYIPPEGEIYRVAVHPDYRRRGLGRLLCDAFLARTEQCYLEVRRSNISARALYESLGFIFSGERKNYYKNPTEDACLYRR